MDEPKAKLHLPITFDTKVQIQSDKILESLIHAL